MGGTLRGAWSRLKPLLEAAMKAKMAAGAKADQQKTNHAIDEFIRKFAPVMAEFENIYKAKEQLNNRFRAAADQGMKLLQPLQQQVEAAHKDGFNADSSLEENLEGRLSEVMGLLKELHSDGCGTQWD